MEFAGRMQGKTVEVGRTHFETEKTRFTILDAPVSMSPHFSDFACNVNKPGREATAIALG
jgi:translation elongation factor EF-1alpha